MRYLFFYPTQLMQHAFPQIHIMATWISWTTPPTCILYVLVGDEAEQHACVPACTCSAWYRHDVYVVFGGAPNFCSITCNLRPSRLERDDACMRGQLLYERGKQPISIPPRRRRRCRPPPAAPSLYSYTRKTFTGMFGRSYPAVTVAPVDAQLDEAFRQRAHR